MMLLYVAAALSFALSAVVVGYLRSPVSRLRVLDEPTDRSLHVKPMPRTGGLGIVAAIIVTIASAVALGVHFPAGGQRLLFAITGGLLIVAAVSLADDLWKLSAAVRLPCHLLAAAVVMVAGQATIRDIGISGRMSADLGVFGGVTTVLFIAWTSNAFNFMDGMDGLTGAMSVIGFGTIAVVAGSRDDALIACLAGSAAAAAAGFLLFNFPPAKIFMGDVGSVPLGFVAGALTAAGVSRGTYDVWVPLLTFSPFLVDATVTVIRRAVRGKKVWSAHREHYYQRLVLAGWTHRRTLVLEIVLMLTVAVAAVAYSHGGGIPRDTILALVLIGYVVLGLAFPMLEGRGTAA